MRLPEALLPFILVVAVVAGVVDALVLWRHQKRNDREFNRSRSDPPPRA